MWWWFLLCTCVVLREGFIFKAHTEEIRKLKDALAQREVAVEERDKQIIQVLKTKF